MAGRIPLRVAADRRASPAPRRSDGRAPAARRVRSGAPPWSLDLFVYARDNPRRHAPDVALAVRHCIVAPLATPQLAGMELMVGGIHEECQGHLESGSDLLGIEVERV